MVKTCNRKILLFLLSFACITCFLSFAFFSIDFKRVEAQELVSELFVVDGVSFEENYNNKGLKVDANQVDGNAKFKTNFYSDLNISFELLTSKIFFIDILDEKNADNAFSIFVEKNSDELNVGVTFDNERVGLYYNDGVLEKKTPQQNQNGKFTSVPIGENSIFFDLETMTVFAIYGDKQLAVWTLTDVLKDTKTVSNPLTQIKEYSVSLRIRNKNSSLLITQFNGHDFSFPVLIDNCAPDIFVDFVCKGVLAQEYYLPVPVAYDFATQEHCLVQVEVRDVNDKILLNKQNYSDELKFIPDTVGSYNVFYYATDKNGFERIEKYELDVVSNEIYSIDYELAVLENDFIGVGSYINIGRAEYKSNANYKTSKTYLEVRVYQDGVDVTDLNYDKNSKTFLFDKSGEYSLVAVSDDKNIAPKVIKTFSVEQGGVTVSDIKVQKIFSVGQTHTFDNLRVSVDGKAIDIEPTLIFPNDTAFKGKNQVFNITGNYTLVYTGKINDKACSFKYGIKVVEGVAEINGGDGSYYYDYDMDADKDDKGLCVTLSSGSVLTFNQIINLSDMKFSDKLFEIYATPEVEGKKEISKLNVVLTDVYNSENTVQFQIEQTLTDDRACYVRAAAVGIGQKMSAWHGEYGDSGYYVDSYYGKHTFINLNGIKRTSENGLSVLPFVIYMDYATKDVGVNCPSQGGSKFIDLDSLSDFSVAWEGFATGECYLSIYAEGFTGVSANLFIKKIYGIDLSQEYNVDNDAPIITLNKGEYFDNLPTAVVGKEYPLMDASAIDVENGSLKVNKKVFVSYYQDKTEIDCYGDKFTPIMAGEYYVEYSATDYAGNTAFKVLKIVAVEQIDEITYSFGDKITQSKVGELLSVADVICVGGSGEKVVVITAISPSGNREIITDGKVIPKEIGEYEIEYKITDYIGNEVVGSYFVVVQQNNELVVLEEPDLPKAFISGLNYNLPNIIAFDYSDVNSVREIVSSISVEIGDKIVEISNDFVPVATIDKEIATIIYTLAGENQTITKKYEIPIRIAKTQEGYILENLFYTENMEVLSTENNISFTSTEIHAKGEFLMPIDARKFDFSFKVNPEKNSAEEIIVYLVDSVDKTQKLKFAFVKRGSEFSKSFLRINDGAEFEIVGSFYDNSIYNFTLNYSNKTLEYDDGVGNVSLIKTTLAGDAFNGFTSGSVLMSFEINDAIGTEIFLNKINGQKFSNSRLDRISPFVELESVDSFTYEIGSIVKIPYIFASDILSKNLKVELSVYDTNNKIMKSTQGVELNAVPAGEYYIKLDRIGTYTYRYVVSDESGNPETVSKVFYVLDNESPVINIEKDKITGTVGKTITLPQWTITDNCDNKVKVYVYVTDKNSKTLKVENGTITLSEKGKYTVVYVAYDSYGNCTIKKIPLTVN